jgi:hypothetical protein
MEQEVGEQRPHPLPVQGDRPAVLDDLQWPENTEFDGNVAFVALVSWDGKGRC